MKRIANIASAVASIEMTTILSIQVFLLHQTSNSAMWLIILSPLLLKSSFQQSYIFI